MGPEVALAVAGIALQAVGTLQQGAQQRAIAEANAEQAEIDRVQAQQQADFRATQVSDRAARLRAANLAARGSSGVALSSGSTEELLLANAEDVALEIAAIRAQGAQASNRFASEAELSRFSGRQAQRGSFIGTGATILTADVTQNAFDDLFREDSVTTPSIPRTTPLLTLPGPPAAGRRRVR
jgi:hypothetical protein